MIWRYDLQITMSMYLRFNVISNIYGVYGVYFSTVYTSFHSTFSYWLILLLFKLNSSNVTPNAQESEDSGLSLSYAILGTEAAKRISSSSPIGEQDHDEDSQVLRQKDRKNNGNSSASYNLRLEN